MRREMLVVLILILLPAALFAQEKAPADATPATRVAVVDFQRAIVENAEGKKAQTEFLAEINKRQAEFDKKQKALAEMENKLRTADKALSDEAKADIGRQIDRTNTDLQRMNDDAQKELGDLQQKLFRPIAERANKILQSYATEVGFAVVLDLSSQANSVVYFSDVADITTEIIRRVDADAAKTAKPAATGAK
jgi:outer membrane protein